MEKQSKMSPAMALLRMLQGALIGLGAVLPGISGGVLCVIFGIYRPVMELLSDPRKNYKTHLSKLAPVIVGMGVGFLGVANLLAFFLDRYPNQSVCLFVGLIGGMLPSLMKQAGEQGRNKASWAALGGAFALVLGLLVALEVFSIQVTPSVLWYLFCGFCLALSVIAPGMSFSTLLMPLGLYTPFVEGLGRLRPTVLVPGIAGAVITVVLLAKAVDRLFERHYSVAFHAIVGVVIAATLVIIPFKDMATSPKALTADLICLAVGIVLALALDRFNARFPKE